MSASSYLTRPGVVHRDDRTGHSTTITAILTVWLVVMAGCVDGGGAELQTISIAALGVGDGADNAEGLAIDVDERRNLALTLTYDDGFEEVAPDREDARDGDEVEWSVADPNIADVNDNGELRGRRVGATEVIATFRDLETRIDVAVSGVPEQLSIRVDNSKVPTGLTLTFSAELRFKHGEKQDVTAEVQWSSSVVEVATIDASGVATGIAPGTTTIAVSGFGLEADKRLEVDDAAVVAIEVAPTTLQLAVGELSQLTATAMFSDGQSADATRLVSWKSSNQAIARVKSSGEVEALMPGAVTISAQKDGVTALVQATVTAAAQ